MTSVKPPTIAVLVGAGASVASGAPSTADLTGIVLNALPTDHLALVGGERISVKVPTAELLTAALSSQSGSPPPDFETIVASVETLMSYVYSDAHSGIKAFTTKNSVFNWLFDGEVLFLMHNAARDSMVEAFRDLPPPTVDRARARQSLTEFFGAIAERGRVVLATLNYDDLLDDVLPWADGFKPRDEYASFEPSLWSRQIASDDHLLMHVHSSVRFGFRRNPQADNWHEPVRYATTAEAARTIIGNTVSAPIADGASLPATPFIMGGWKSPKLMHNARPYAYYASTALQQFAAADKLIIVGYGFRDEHVNQWITQWRLQGRNDGLAIITLRTGSDIGRNTQPLEKFLNYSGASSWIRNSIYEPVGGAEPSATRGIVGRMYLVADGLPINAATQSDVLKYLFE